MGPQSCGRGWWGTPLPGITTTATGERETARRQSVWRTREPQAGGRLWEGPLLSPSLSGDLKQTLPSCT